MKFNFLKFFTGISIISEEKSFTFLDLYNRIIHYQDILKQYDSRVIAIKGDFNFETISFLLASSTCNNVIVPIVFTNLSEFDTKIKASSVNFIFDFTTKDNLSILKCSDEFVKIAAPGLILFSSGTTGNPKMMFHEFKNLFNLFETPIRRQRNISILLFLMFDHIGGLNTLLNSLKDGSIIVIPSVRTPDHILYLIEKCKINVLPTTPTFLNLLLINSNLDYAKLSSLKLISYGTERMPEQVLLKVKKYLPNVKLLQTFGTSETGILKTVSKSSDSLFFKIEDDRYQYKIVDGILLIKSILNVKGYLNLESDKFDKEGWYNTGDIVQQDEDGYLMIVGRVNEVINVGGLKVMPTEIENILLQFEGIVDCLVFGQNNSIMGQMVAAKIVINSNTLNDSTSELELKKKIKFFCKERLDKFKIPAKIEFVENIHYSNRFKKNIK